MVNVQLLQQNTDTPSENQTFRNQLMLHTHLNYKPRIAARNKYYISMQVDVYKWIVSAIILTPHIQRIHIPAWHQLEHHPQKIVSNDPFDLCHLRKLYYTPKPNTRFYHSTDTAQNQQGAEIHTTWIPHLNNRSAPHYEHHAYHTNTNL
jgi:hypothetical protein